MRPLIIIPARGGSKGIPGKNIKYLHGKPLIQYTMDAARDLFDDAQICVSTDSNEIKDLVEKMGLKVPFLRPLELATDTASTHEVLLHALNYYESNGYTPDVIILLQVTSPFRTSKHIKEAFKMYEPACDMVVSVFETKSNPYYVLFEENDKGWLRKSKIGEFTRRQDCPKVWEYNGAVYVINSNSLKVSKSMYFKKIKKYVMDEESSLDIDSPLDWQIAETMMKIQKETL